MSESMLLHPRGFGSWHSASDEPLHRLYALMVRVFLIGCIATLAAAQEKSGKKETKEDMLKEEIMESYMIREYKESEQQYIPRFPTNNPQAAKNVADKAGKGVDEALSKDLLDIIKILYKGQEADIRKLESVQATMESKMQIERRIALIKATLSQ